MRNKQIHNITGAIERLKYYCAIQDRCQWDVLQKMNKWNLQENTKNHILQILITEKYVDEERFSISFSRGKFKIKQWGRIKIRSELKQKEISDIYIEKGLAEIKENEYLNVLDKLLKKKQDKITEKNHFIKKAKIANFLIQRGFESFLVWEKVKDLQDI
tara:strand:- start:471 stop:947 length:477 start_codon:yes stop_codon:yes gene_type:complete